ncbi:MAG: DUF3800 domain-containing protein [Anaerolineae bacterium]
METQTRRDLDDELEESGDRSPIEVGESTTSDLDQVRDEILSNVLATRVDKHRDRVAWILNHFPATRDSDIELQIEYWRNFEDELQEQDYISFEQYKTATRLTSLVRWRARIQNEYQLFRASETVQKHRGTLQSDHLESARVERPRALTYDVVIDESGKTGAHLIVGSVWFLEVRLLIPLVRRIRALQVQLPGGGEFHFQKIRETNKDIYIQLIDILARESNAVSFKLISSPRRGVRDERDLLQVLTYNLLRRGVEHEHSTGRATLPRELGLLKDAEESGSDALFLSKLKEELQRASTAHFDGRLLIGEFRARPSDEHWSIQIADLWAGSINRVLNQGHGTGAKDVVASYFMSQMNVNSIDDLSRETVGSAVVHFRL